VTASRQLLSIGEFAEATQLTPKALRLYDEQGLLRPTSVDAANGYRYYSSAQIAAGRLIRTLREMSASLSEISRIVGSPEGQAEMLLVQLAREMEQRRAAERRAFEAALRLMRRAPRGDALGVEARTLPVMTATVHLFSANALSFGEMCRRELQRAQSRTERTRVGPVFCALLDPLSADDGRIELLLPLDPAADASNEAAVRTLRAARCAVLPIRSLTDLTAALDAAFDWLDRHGERAAAPPLLRLADGDAAAPVEVLWPYAFIDSMETPR
jgi:DNA-binding transcriptional MerR regulator